MKVIGFNFEKIGIERKKTRVDKINIKTNIDISDIKPLKSEILNTKDNILETSFSYTVKYEPDFATVSVNGSVLITLGPREAKEVLKQWKKKKMPEDFRVFLFNMIFKKAALKALNLEDELNIPLHLPMPSFKKQEEK
jgi:hypothetical protein